MDAIKVYKAVDREDEKRSFDIRRMEEIYDKHKGQADVPHRHDFYIILVVIEGKGEHGIDFNTYRLSNQQCFFISPGQVHQLVENIRPEGFALTFSEQFLLEHNIEAHFIERLNLFHDYGNSPPLELNTQEMAELKGLCIQMMEYNNSDKKFKAKALAALLQLFLVSCNNLCSLTVEENTQVVEAGTSILQNFKRLVETNYRNWHQVKDYANELHVTADHLNKTIKSLIGKSAKEYLQNRLVLGAKRLLLFTDLSTKEISFQLGFSEPAHFSTFFKNCTGKSPSAFKKQ